MRVKSDAPKSVNKDRSRYYKARADKVEMENAERRKNLIPANQIELICERLLRLLKPRSGRVRSRRNCKRN
jgi:hypothetical protein